MGLKRFTHQLDARQLDHHSLPYIRMPNHYGNFVKGATPTKEVYFCNTASTDGCPRKHRETFLIWIAKVFFITPTVYRILWHVPVKVKRNKE